MNFGLSEYVPNALYFGGILALLLTVLWRPVVGMYYLVPLIPLQTVRYWINDLPLGQSVIDVMTVGVVVGLLVRRKKILPKTPLDVVLLIYAVYTFLSLCWGSYYLHMPLPLSPKDPRLADWKSYMTMPLMLYLTVATVQDRRQFQVIIVLMCLAVFTLDRTLWSTVSGRDFSTYSDALREEGSMGYAGVNGLAAFEAQYATLLLALAGNEKRRIWWLGFIALAIFSSLCLMYSLSRGGYAAFLVGWVFIGLLQQRKLLVLFVAFLLCWTAVVPNAVRQRVFMTYDQERGGLEESADTRLELWNDAVEVVKTSPLFGTGFNTYAYMGRIGFYRDTHNIYLKVLVETGFVGLTLFLLLLWQLARLGWRTYRTANDPLVRALGLGLMGWLACTAVANFFGDRWTYLQVNGYLWVTAGLVWQGLRVHEAAQAESAAPAGEPEQFGEPALDAY